jgi:hypothetical protein
MPTTRKYAVPEGGTRFMRGGYLKEVPLPHKRWYNGRRKREVTIGVYVWWGTGSHYYVNVDEDDNAIWNTKEKLWHLCWDDPEKGKRFNRKFDNVGEAVKYVRTLVRKHFPKKTHKLLKGWHNLNAAEDKRVWLGLFKY